MADVSRCERSTNLENARRTSFGDFRAASRSACESRRSAKASTAANDMLTLRATQLSNWPDQCIAISNARTLCMEMDCKSLGRESSCRAPCCTAWCLRPPADSLREISPIIRLDDGGCNHPHSKQDHVYRASFATPLQQYCGEIPGWD